MVHRNVFGRNLFLLHLLLLVGFFFFTSASAFAQLHKASSAQLIEEAYKNRVIDKETYVIQKIKSYFSPHNLNSEFKSSIPNTPSREMTMLLDLAINNYNSFSKESQNFVDIFLRRPVAPSTGTPSDRPIDPTYVPPDDIKNANFYLTNPLTFEPAVAAYPHIGGKLKFWYVTTGAHATTLDFVKQMASAFDTVYHVEIDTLLYPAPPNDPGGATYGGDTKFDVYVMDVEDSNIDGVVKSQKMTFHIM